MNPFNEPVNADACATALELLPLHVGGDLDPIEARQVELHLSSCAGCRVAAQRLTSARQHFFEVGLSSAAEELAARGLWVGIEAELERERQANEVAKSASRQTRRDQMSNDRRRAAAGESPRLDHGAGTTPTHERVDASSRADDVSFVELGGFLSADRADTRKSSTRSARRGSLAWLSGDNYPGRRAVRLMAGAVVVTAAALFVALVVTDPPSKQVVDPEQGGGLTAELDPHRVGSDQFDGLAPEGDALAGNGPFDPSVGGSGLEGSGFERLTPEDGTRRLVLQPRELEGGALRGGREALVGYPTWR